MYWFTFPTKDQMPIKDSYLAKSLISLKSAQLSLASSSCGILLLKSAHFSVFSLDDEASAEVEDWFQGEVSIATGTDSVATSSKFAQPSGRNFFILKTNFSQMMTQTLHLAEVKVCLYIFYLKIINMCLTFTVINIHFFVWLWDNFPWGVQLLFTVSAVTVIPCFW